MFDADGAFAAEFDVAVAGRGHGVGVGLCGEGSVFGVHFRGGLHGEFELCAAGEKSELG